MASPQPPPADPEPVNPASRPAPTLSVILPVYNAMPWLPITIRDMLKQQLANNEPLELLCAFDGGGDGSLVFLLELAALLGARATVEVCELRADGRVVDSNPALAAALRQPEDADHPSFAAAGPPGELVGEGQQLLVEPLSAADVAACARPEHALRVLRYADGKNRGQGAAMSLALSMLDERSPFIAQVKNTPTVYGSCCRSLCKSLL